MYVQKIENMRVITTREIARQTKTYFELAKVERVSVKRGNDFVNLIVTDKPDATFVNDEWIKEFMEIPMEYRCNPFDVSPSGDLFFADKRNVEQLDKAIEQAKNGKTKRMKKGESLDEFLNRMEECIE